MPRKDYREKHRKKTRYSSDSSDSDERTTKRYSRERGRVRSKSSREKSSKYHKRDSSTRSSSSSSRGHSSRSSSSSSSTTSSNGDKKASGKNKKDPSKQSNNEQPATKTFDLEELYKDKDQTTKTLDDIEADTFKPASFKSQKKIVVDLEKDKIMVPSSSTAGTNEEESLIHPDYLGDDQKRVDKWIKKLHLYRNQ